MQFYAILPAMESASAPISEATDFPAIIQLKDQRIMSLEGENSLLKEQLFWLKKQIFGQKSERIVADLDTQPLLPEIATTDPQAKEPEKGNRQLNTIYPLPDFTAMLT